jgi:triacylglycerol lipase
MATLSQLAYEFPSKEPFPSKDTKLGHRTSAPTEFSELGLSSITYFHNGMTDGYAYLAEGNRLIVLAFRGTSTPKNWKTNFQVGMINPKGTDAHLLVHEGFYRAFTVLSSSERGITEFLREVISRTAGRVPIYTTGHSLGGALAQIATAVYGSDQLAACYTFGSPRVGNPYFDLWVKPPSYRIMNGADLVPQTPFPVPYFYPYRHAGDARYLPDAVGASPFRYQPGLFVRIGQLSKGLAMWILSGSLDGIADHGINSYKEKLLKIADNRTQSR